MLFSPSSLPSFWSLVSSLTHKLDILVALLVCVFNSVSLPSSWFPSCLPYRRSVGPLTGYLVLQYQVHDGLLFRVYVYLRIPVTPLRMVYHKSLRFVVPFPRVLCTGTAAVHVHIICVDNITGYEYSLKIIFFLPSVSSSSSVLYSPVLG